MEKNKYWVWLSLIKDLGSRKKQKLLEIYKTPENIYKLNKIKVPRLSIIIYIVVYNTKTNKKVLKSKKSR